MYIQAIQGLQSSAVAAGVKAQHPTNIPGQAWGPADKKLKSQTAKKSLPWFAPLCGCWVRSMCFHLAAKGV